MIMRTNKADGAVIYLGEEGHDDVTTYTTIQMLDGKVKGITLRIFMGEVSRKDNFSQIQSWCTSGE